MAPVTAVSDILCLKDSDVTLVTGGHGAFAEGAALHVDQGQHDICEYSVSRESCFRMCVTILNYYHFACLYCESATGHQARQLHAVTMACLRAVTESLRDGYRP